MSKAIVILLALIAVVAGCVQPVSTGDQIPADAMEEKSAGTVADAVEVMEEITPGVTVDNQNVVSGTVTIGMARAAQSGFIVIHADKAGGGPGEVIGQTHVEKGDNANVIVNIDEAKATPVLHAMLHVDAGEHDVYEFPGDDVPVLVDDSILNVPFSALNIVAEPVEIEAPQRDTAAEEAMASNETGTAMPDGVMQFDVMIDDNSVEPGTINVTTGDTVRINFHFNDDEIYFGGLDVKSGYWDTVKYRHGSANKTRTVEFTANKTFIYTGYWPATDRAKASGKVEVTG